MRSGDGREVTLWPRFWLGGYGNGEGEFDCLAGVAVNRIGQFIIADRLVERPPQLA